MIATGEAGEETAAVVWVGKAVGAGGSSAWLVAATGVGVGVVLQAVTAVTIPTSMKSQTGNLSNCDQIPCETGE